MDTLDQKIISLLKKNARITIKDMADKVCLTSPAVAARIKKLEETGVIRGYTVLLSSAYTHNTVSAIISINVPPEMRDPFKAALEQEDCVEECYQVTGQQSHMVKVRCPDVAALEELVHRMQKMGQTHTQIILSVVHRPGGLDLEE